MSRDFVFVFCHCQYIENIPSMNLIARAFSYLFSIFDIKYGNIAFDFLILYQMSSYNKTLKKQQIKSKKKFKQDFELK